MSLNILNIALSAKKEIFWHNFFFRFFSSGCTSILRIGVEGHLRQNGMLTWFSIKMAVMVSHIYKYKT